VSRGEALGVTCPLLVLLVQPTLLACPVCFQVEQNSTTHGLQAAVLVLIGVTTGVLAGFGLFIVRLVRRS
jgi:threonine/homoserine/homoserine lactone efflux protein